MRRGDALSFEDVRASLWFAPSVAAGLALLAALALAEVTPAGEQSRLGRLP